MNTAIIDTSDEIVISVSDGWVTLEGQVRWRSQKNAAEDAVRYLDGVTGVTNRIRIIPPASPQGLRAASKTH